MKKINLSNVPEQGEFQRLTAGGYICRITKVEDKPEKEYLYIEYDIAKGDFAGYYQELFDNRNFWGGRFYKSYKETALPMFKRFCSAVSKSNNGYVFDGETNADESTLVGKLVGLVLCEEEYYGNDGNIKTRLYVDREMPVEDITNNKIKIKPLKTIEREETSAPASTDNTDFMKIADGSPEEFPFA